MKAGLMIPCYMDMFYPKVGIATVELLEKLRVDFEYLYDQTCCGQPMANSGCYNEAKATEDLFIQLFHGCDYIMLLPEAARTISEMSSLPALQHLREKRSRRRWSTWSSFFMPYSRGISFPGPTSLTR